MPKRAVAIAALLGVVAAGCGRTGQPAPDVWAVVNGQQIHRAEAEKYYSNRLRDQGQAQQTAPPQSQEEALTLMLNIVDELVNNDILIQRAQKLGVQATDG